MEIRKVDDKPMDIHVKKKSTLHVRRRDAKEPEKEGSRRVTGKPEKTKQPSGRQDKTKKGTEKKESRQKVFAAEDMVVEKKSILPDAAFLAAARTACGEMDGGKEAYLAPRASDVQAKPAFRAVRAGRKETEKKEGRTEKSAAKNTAAEKKSILPDTVFSAAARTALDEMDGGEEVHQACLVAGVAAEPVSEAARAGRNLFHSKAAGEKQQKIRNKESASRIKEKMIKESGGRAEKRTVRIAVRKKGRKAAEETIKVTGGAGSMSGGTMAGQSAESTARKKNGKRSARNRMIRMFAAKLSQEEKQGGIGGAVKEAAAMRFFMAAKKILRYAGLFLSVLFALVALLALPVIAVLAVIYNSPLAIFFPSISSGETTQEVLSAYVAEFNQRIEEELAVHPGCDAARKTYAGFEGVGEPDNFPDILAVYMVKYGNGDTATDMTDAAKANLKAVFGDMRSYSITEGQETITHEDGSTETSTVKNVNVELKTYRDMTAVYGFNEEEQAMLEELMNLEYRAAISPDGTSGGVGAGGGIGAEQYQAILDAVSDENGKQVVAFALSKVGYPYSQAYRSSGKYYDCSSLAYYAWKAAGVDISYGGSNTAAAEGRYCYENQYLVSFEEMQPGDLIFYSYGNNGRFMNITHVALYVGEGNAVEAVNEQVGVICHAVPTGSIVFIGRPRG